MKEITEPKDIDRLYGRSPKNTYLLDKTKLAEIVACLHESRTDNFPILTFKPEGIAIRGTLTSEENPGSSLTGDIGRIVDGSRIQQNLEGLYLQIYEYDCRKGFVPKENPAEILKEYIKADVTSRN